MSTKYDLEEIRKAIKPTWAMPAAGCYYDEDEDPDGSWCAYHVRRLQPHWWIQAAKSLHSVLDQRYRTDLEQHTVGDERSKWVRYGDTVDLNMDDSYSCGVCDEPDPATEILEAYVQLWHPRRKWPIWVFFTSGGIEFCKTSRQRKGMIFAMKPFLKWGWEDPGVWQGVSRWLTAVGFPVEWSPEEALA